LRNHAGSPAEWRLSATPLPRLASRRQKGEKGISNGFWPLLRNPMAAQDEGWPLMPAFEVAPKSPIVCALNRSCLRVRGRAQPTGAITPPAFYGTDAGHLLAKAGMEGVVCGPGGRYNTMPDERVDIAGYLDMIRIDLLTILEICEHA
jgi:acetylornithine deacetylase